jgi:hypothetical protein
MSWLARLFGTSAADAKSVPSAPTAEIEHHGFIIRAEPYKAEDGQFQTAGTILKEIDGEERRHQFVRADRFPTIESATEMALQKGRQIVEQQGERMFSPGRN